jgi:hypothetical protein
MREPTGSRERRGAASESKKGESPHCNRFLTIRARLIPKADAAVLSGIFAAAGRHRIEIAGARLPMKMELAE